MIGRSRAFTVLALAGVAALALTLAAPSVTVRAALTPSAQNQPPPPTFRTEANYVRVDAFPTRGGVPVTDLTQADFDIVEGGTRQTIDAFEHVVISGGSAQETRREPNSVEESRQAAQNPRARVFVLFLDVNHVSIDGSHNIRRPLVEALDRLIGPDDLVAVMTPEMSARDITFARKTVTIDGILTRYWHWGERDRLNTVDPQEREYAACFPGSRPITCADGSTADDRGIADKMIERRREKLTLAALHDLVTYLRGVREERKAVIAISDGWRLFQPDADLAQRQVSCRAPGPPQVTVDPRTGKLTGKTPPTLLSGPNPDSCEADRQTLAYIDDEQTFRYLLDEANAANTSFYPVDPRGLVVFDEPLDKPRTGLPPRGSTTLTPPSVDLGRLRARLTSLRTLAEATDGLAIVDSNDLAAGFRRVVADLSSYYLLGYYSTGKLDGRFHPITVRVKRPGVSVRARRGYLAATAAPTGSGAARSGGPGAAASSGMSAEAEAESHAVAAAVGPLAGYSRDVPLRLQVAAGWKPGDTASAALWVVGELGGAALVGDAWTNGFDATVTLATPADATVATARATVPRGARAFRVTLAPSQSLPPGDYVLRVAAAAGPAAIPTRDTMRITIPASPGSFGAIFLRRGQATGNREVPTADLRFRRSEQVRVEIPTPGDGDVSARLLDRTGKPLAVPVASATREDADGSRWITAQLSLAPLAPGDYVIEVGTGGKRMLSAFRVVP